MNPKIQLPKPQSQEEINKNVRDYVNREFFAYPRPEPVFTWDEVTNLF